MLRSMTGFASVGGEEAGFYWTWDIRAVNARALDIRTRLPDWIDGLEDAVRKALKGAVARGSVSVSLKMNKRDEAAALTLDADGLARAIAQLMAIGAEAEANGLPVAQISAADIAAMRGVLEHTSATGDDTALLTAVTAQLPELLIQFNESRASEGGELTTVLMSQVDEVEALVKRAKALLPAREKAQASMLKAALARVLDNSDGADSDRVAQELALIAVKSDIREELDRLSAHVSAARAHLSSDQPVGRKLDFLMQEFNREANTLCSKAQFKKLTSVGLDLKHVIDQMREQVQNVE